MMRVLLGVCRLEWRGLVLEEMELMRYDCQ